jgi:hypothetical protein
MTVHHQKVSCRIQALWYNVLSKYIYGIMVNHQCVLYIEWHRHREVEAALWLGE